MRSVGTWYVSNVSIILIFHAIIISIATCFIYTSWIFYAFSDTNLLTRCRSVSSCFLLFFSFIKASREKFSELDKIQRVQDWDRHDPTLVQKHTLEPTPESHLSRLTIPLYVGVSNVRLIWAGSLRPVVMTAHLRRPGISTASNTETTNISSRLQTCLIRDIRKRWPSHNPGGPTYPSGRTIHCLHEYIRGVQLTEAN